MVYAFLFLGGGVQFNPFPSAQDCGRCFNFIGWLRSTRVDSSTTRMIACMTMSPLLHGPNVGWGVFLGDMLWAELLSQHSYAEVLTPALQNVSDFRDRALKGPLSSDEVDRVGPCAMNPKQGVPL